MKRRRLTRTYRRGKNDCLRRAVAHITGQQRVPHFVGHYPGRWLRPLNAWLVRRGFALIECRRATLSENITRWINIGPTRRGTHHAVVMEAKPGEPAVATEGAHTRLLRVTQTLIIVKVRP